jgi:hypothetical protein
VISYRNPLNKVVLYEIDSFKLSTLKEQSNKQFISKEIISMTEYTA